MNISESNSLVKASRRLAHSFIKRKSESKKLGSNDVCGISLFGVSIRISEFRLRKLSDFRGSGVSKTCHPP
jgi:hypothetical protein